VATKTDSSSRVTVDVSNGHSSCGAACPSACVTSAGAHVTAFTVHNTGKWRAATASLAGAPCQPERQKHHHGLGSRRQEAQIINACGENALADRLSCRNGQDPITKMFTDRTFHTDY